MTSGVSKALRNIVAERDSYTCILCEQPYTDIHHHEPRSQGGRDVPWNLVCLCRAHHRLVHRDIACLHGLDFAHAEYWIAEYLGNYYADDIEAIEEMGNPRYELISEERDGDIITRRYRVI